MPQLMRGLCVILFIVPSVGMALSAFHGRELRSAFGLLNLMRNLGGAIGIATVTTWLNDAGRTQAARFGDALGGSAGGFIDFVGATAARLSAITTDPNRALLMAQAVDEVFLTMAWMFVAALVMVPFCRVLKPAAPVFPADSH